MQSAGHQKPNFLKTACHVQFLKWHCLKLSAHSCTALSFNSSIQSTRNNMLKVQISIILMQEEFCASFVTLLIWGGKQEPSSVSMQGLTSQKINTAESSPLSVHFSKTKPLWFRFYRLPLFLFFLCLWTMKIVPTRIYLTYFWCTLEAFWMKYPPTQTLQLLRLIKERRNTRKYFLCKHQMMCWQTFLVLQKSFLAFFELIEKN